MDKTKGAGNGIAGGVGEAAGSPRLETEGAAQELKGTVENKVGEANGAAPGAMKETHKAADREG